MAVRPDRLSGTHCDSPRLPVRCLPRPAVLVRSRLPSSGCSHPAALARPLSSGHFRPCRRGRHFHPNASDSIQLHPILSDGNGCDQIRPSSPRRDPVRAAPPGTPHRRSPPPPGMPPFGQGRRPRRPG
ncbi:hypothetical protein SSCG_00880 [Streptomyces clavuligerus]|nr:hypothetical protein SSCG_00880 [Streptomyces clavuligerus]